MKTFLFLSVFVVLAFAAKPLFAQIDDYTYHKAFVEDDSRNYRAVEFKKSGIYIDGKKAAILNPETFGGAVMADFDEIGERVFVVVTAVTQGTYGYRKFSVVSIDEKMNVKVSAGSSDKECFGENPDLSIFWGGSKGKDQRLISIADSYKYNIDTGKWSLIKVRALRKRKR